jgi:hypothetical protein
MAMNVLDNPLIIIGALLLAASVAAYFVNQEKHVFPVVLALGGIFLCAANSVKASIGGLGTIEFQRTVAVANDANSTLLVQQEAAIKSLASALQTLQTSFTAYQGAVNERFDQLAATPVSVPAEEQERIEESSAQLGRQIERIEMQTRSVVTANRVLREAVKVKP